ncbi:Protein of unknown function [Cohaesibacter sp. ES.047]|uniref:Lcl C-terminal domain-containing protein n=1 Tax=Cohaesibacter sp. ES.047 TaxID=1798205 RepID=UPI000BB780D9|nr:DUF1566 domain-containing protein [Cohaesibacter sp. ES.047]SNY94018.1 Protein of unknown function [Cohaesibacter sp. ES.047]
MVCLGCVFKASKMRTSCLVLVVGVLTATSSFANCQDASGNGFELKGATAVQDEKGLEWQRCAVGMRWSGGEGTCVGEPQGRGLEEMKLEAKKLGQGWRVPTAEEFDNIYFESCSGPKIDTIVFPGIEASDFGDGAEFWTVTSATLPRMYYYFNITHGYVDAHSAGFSLSGLLVRNHQ